MYLSGCSLHAGQSTVWLLNFLSSLFTLKLNAFRSEISYIRSLIWFSGPENLQEFGDFFFHLRKADIFH